MNCDTVKRVVFTSVLVRREYRIEVQRHRSTTVEHRRKPHDLSAFLHPRNVERHRHRRSEQSRHLGPPAWCAVFESTQHKSAPEVGNERHRTVVCWSGCGGGRAGGLDSGSVCAASQFRHEHPHGAANRVCPRTMTPKGRAPLRRFETAPRSACVATAEMPVALESQPPMTRHRDSHAS
jgi:hypothetical protein